MDSHDAMIDLGEMLSKFQQTANRSLRETYARRAKELIVDAERGIDKSNPEQWAGFRSLRNRWIEQIDYQFPELQRYEERAGLSGYSLGSFEGFFNWYTLAGICGLVLLLKRMYRPVAKKRKKK